jgi:23S rRNA pseudouridine1911/1915/1917 synthase
MEVVVDVNQKRIDRYLADYLKESRNTIQKMIDEEYILVNDKKTKANHELKVGDKVLIKDGFTKEMNIVPEKIKLDIVYEDHDLMIINKPSGMVVHPGNGNSSGTLVNALMAYTKDLSDGSAEFRPGIVHRIDKDTSGLIIVAKNNKCHELLAEDFKNKNIHREYIALLIGEFKNDTATIDAPIGRDKLDRKKMCVTDINSKKAVTHLTVLKRYEGYTLVKLALETGRTHQIRVHMKYIGYPVFNDPVYTNHKCTSFGQFLHSASVDFIHPITKEHLHFECPLPKEFADYLNTLTSL